MFITEDIFYIGVNDCQIDLFEGMFRVPEGVAYNSYVILDEKIAVFDTVDEAFAELWLEKLDKALVGRKPDYLIVQHMEPDHSANILRFVRKYPNVFIVSSAKAFGMMDNYFGEEFKTFSMRRITVSDGDKLSLGKHKLTFVTAPMVHWPEVIMTYDSTSKTLFTADAFGRFGIWSKECAAGEKSIQAGKTAEAGSGNEVCRECEKRPQELWVKEAARYYFGIVGKYGVYVQKLFQKLEGVEIERLCPLHGEVLSENIGYYLDKYNKWSGYEPDEEGVMIAYTSVYGNTKKAALLLAETLRKAGCRVVVHDLARCDRWEAVADAFRYDRLVLATTTYNAGIFPFMREYIESLAERNFCNRRVGFIENGGWAVVAAKLMRERLEKCKGLVFAENTVRIVSAMNAENEAQVEALAEELLGEKMKV